MARRNRSNENDSTGTTGNTATLEPTDSTTPDAEEATSVTTSTEFSTDASTETAAPDASTETAAPETAAPVETPAKEEVVIDLTEFKAAVEAAVAQRDETSGDVPEELKAPVAAAYRALDGAKAKKEAKKFLNDSMRESMDGMDIHLARAYMVLSDGLAAAVSTGEKRERVPVDPTQALVERLGGLYLAAELAVANAPDGLDYAEKLDTLLEESHDSAATYLTWATRPAVAEGEEDAPEPDVTAVVKAAVKLALGKSARVGGATRSAGTSTAAGDGVRRNIGKHILEVFETVESGTFLTVAEIRKVATSEYGAETPPSAGAISSRLYPNGGGDCTIVGIVPGTNAAGNRGATKE